MYITLSSFGMASPKNQSMWSASKRLCRPLIHIVIMLLASVLIIFVSFLISVGKA